MIRSRKGATEFPLVIGYIVLMLVIAVFFFFVYQRIAESKTLASAGTTSYDIGTLIEVAYASPGDVEIEYENAFDTDGLPAIGTLLVNGDKNKIITHQYNEDEIYYNIMNNAMTAWGLGAAIQGGRKINEELKQRAMRKGRAQVGEWYFDVYSKQYFDAIDNPKWIDAFANTIDGSAGPYMKNMIGDPISLQTMNQLAINSEMEKVLLKSGDNPKLIAQIAQASPPAKRLWIIEANSKQLGLDGATYLKSAAGQKVLDTVSLDQNILDYWENAPTKNFEDFSKNFEMFGDVDVNNKFSLIANNMENSGMARKLATEKGDKALQFLAKGKNPLYAGVVGYADNLPNEAMRNVISDPGKLKTFNSFMESDSGKLFSEFSGKTNFKRGLFKDVVKATTTTSSGVVWGIDAAEAENILNKNKGLKKSLTKAGYTTLEAQKEVLVSASEAKQAAPEFIDSLTKIGVRAGEGRSFIADYGESGIKEALKTKELEYVSKANKASDFAKAKKAADNPSFWKKISQGFAMKRWREQSFISRSAKRVIAYVRQVGWVKKAGVMSSEAMAKVGKKLLGEAAAEGSLKGLTKLGTFTKGIGVGLAGGGVIIPLEKCAEMGAGPVSVVCAIGAYAAWVGMIAVDFVTTTYPFLMMVIEGRSTSSDMTDLGQTFKYVGISDSVIYADPPNCDTNMDRLSWLDGLGESYSEQAESTKNLFDKDGWGWLKLIYEFPLNILGYLGPVFGEFANMFPGWDCTQEELSTPTVNHHLEIDGTCMDSGGSCPNPYVSANTFEKYSELGDKIVGNAATFYWPSAMTFCSITGMAKQTLGMVCYFGLYAELGAAMIAAPEYLVPWLTSANIYPSDTWWYSNTPVTIEIKKEYNDQNQQEVSIYAS